jgi:hypothetical protein
VIPLGKHPSFRSSPYNSPALHYAYSGEDRRTWTQINTHVVWRVASLAHQMSLPLALKLPFGVTQRYFNVEYLTTKSDRTTHHTELKTENHGSRNSQCSTTESTHPEKEKKKYSGSRKTVCSTTLMDPQYCWDICKTEIPLGIMSGTQVQEP